MLIDCAGGVFNDLSLVWKGGEFDILASVCYSLVVVMDALVVVAACILNPRAKRRMEAEKAAVESPVERGTSDPAGQAMADPEQGSGRVMSAEMH
jgi:hypothetical protein